MTYTVANFGHVEWQGLDLFEATSNSAQLSVVSSPLQTGFSRSLQFTGNASRGQVGYSQYGASTNITAGNAIIWHGYFRWSDISPATEYPFLAFDSNTSLFSSSYLSLVLETDGDIRVRDAADATVATITAPLTVDTFHRFEIRFTADSSAGQVQIWIDGTEVLSNQTGQVFGGVAQMDYVHIGGPLASSGNMFFAGAVTYSDSTTTADRLDSDFEIIGPYQNTDTTTTDTGAGDVAGDALDAGDWTDAGETPVNTSNVASYTGTPRDGGVYLDSGARAGPSGDGRITGTIDAMQAVFIASRGTGGGTTHTLVAGNKTDEYDAAATFAPAIATSFAPYFLISEAATAVPTSSQYGLLGFEVSGAQDLNIGDMAMFLLHVPAAGTTVDLAAGSFALTGYDTTITAGRAVALDAGSYSLTGYDTTIVRDVPVSLDAGSYALTGYDTVVTTGGPSTIPVALDAGSYALSGYATTITRDVSVPLDAGSFTLTGNDMVFATGTGAISTPVVTSSATGNLAKDATGSISTTVPTTSSIGEIEKTSTGSISTPAITGSGSGNLAKDATGAISTPVVTSSATGSILGEVTGTGAIDTTVVTSSATGNLAKDATGAISTPVVTSSASGSILGKVTGTGAIDTTVVTSSATGNLAKDATGAIDTTVVTSSATGERTLTGTGATSTAAVTGTGSGNLAKDATGAISTPAVTGAGSGTAAGTVITGTGAIDTPSVTSSSTGEIAKVGTSASVVSNVISIATGRIVKVGTGAISTPTVTSSATGSLAKDATGSATIIPITGSGTGTRVGAADGTARVAEANGLETPNSSSGSTTANTAAGDSSLNDVSDQNTLNTITGTSGRNGVAA